MIVKFTADKPELIAFASIVPASGIREQMIVLAKNGSHGHEMVTSRAAIPGEC